MFRRKEKARTATIKPLLDPDGSGALRDQLLIEVNHLSSADAAATWAHRIMAAKNSLAAADARRVEDAFAAKIADLGKSDEDVINAPSSSSEVGQPRLPQTPRAAEPGEVAVSNRVDKSLLAITGTASVSRQDPRQIRVQATLSDLWAPADGCASPSVCPASCAGAQGERRIHRPAVPRPPSRGAPIRRRSLMVEQSRNRSHWRRPGALDRDTPASAGSPSAEPRSGDGRASNRFGFNICSAAAQSHPKSQNNEANFRGGRSMTSFRQIEANRRNARKSTGPITEEGKQRSRCNAVRHGLTAETVISALEDAEDYKAFEAAIIADYDAQSAVERELVLRLASLLWRLRRATAIETGLFDIQAEYMREFRRGRQVQTQSQEIIYAKFERVDSADNEPDRLSYGFAIGTEARPGSGPKSVDPATDLARCFLRLANLPSYPLDRISRYEATLWRQTGQILLALDALDRRKPQERGRRFRIGRPQAAAYERDER